MATVVAGLSMRLTPATSAPSAREESMSQCPRWEATRDEEHAVSVLMQGPVCAGERSTLLSEWALVRHSASAMMQHKPPFLVSDTPKIEVFSAIMGIHNSPNTTKLH